tara:strand:+ start:183 stop:1208 length:1026 start_codon:yes stop_codon:yes gene_type:complete
MSKDKIKIHIRNNHWKKGSLPCDLEGEKNSSVPRDLFESMLNKYPDLKNKVSYLVDWDDDNWESSMKEADILLAWNFPTNGLSKIAPSLKWIHIVSAGVNHLYPFNWMKKHLVLTNSSGIHAKKAGEFGLMSILMLQNHMTRIITNQRKREFVTLLSNPINKKKVVVIGTGSLGGAMIKHINLLGAKVLGVNRRGRAVEGCSKVMTYDKIDEILPDADFLYLAVPETNETKGLICKKRLDLLKSTCGIVNIGRESVMDYEHLRKKLNKNEISGAILDVFSEEPINRSSKYWDTPNLLITPHISSDSKGNYIEMVLEKFFQNLNLFINNKDLINQVDPNLGY